LSAISFSISLLPSIHRNGQNDHTFDKQAEDVFQLLAAVIEKGELKVSHYKNLQLVSNITQNTRLRKAFKLDRQKVLQLYTFSFFRVQQSIVSDVLFFKTLERYFNTNYVVF